MRVAAKYNRVKVASKLTEHNANLEALDGQGRAKHHPDPEFRQAMQQWLGQWELRKQYIQKMKVP